MKVGAAKIAPTFSNSAFCLFCLPDLAQTELLEVALLQGLLTQISRPGRPAICIRDFDPPHPPFTFYLHFCMLVAQPLKNAFCRPQQTRTTSTDGPLTLQAGPRHPRGRACPVGWPSAAPVPVDAGHPVWGVVPACGDAPIQSHSWSAIMHIMREKRFCTVFGSIALQE